MKIIILFFGISFLCLTGASAQKMTKVDSEVTLEMTDGSTIKGWNRTKFMNIVRFIEISDTPKGERTRYENDQVRRIVFDDGTVFVKRDVCKNPQKNKTYPDSWVKVEYEGNGITVYSFYSEPVEHVANVRKKSQQRNYYISLGDDNPVWAATNFISGGMTNRSGFNRTMLNYYFSKRYPQYAEFAKRIKDKEFDTKESPMEVVRAWEEAYGNK